MSKTKKKIKMLIVGMLVFVLVCSSVGSVYAITVEESSIEKYSIVKNKKFVDVSLFNKLYINNSIDKCLVDGTIAANVINKLVSNKEDFEIGVRQVLNKYYSTEKSDRGELKDFVSTIDDSAKQIVANYAEAARERENKDNLSYETEKVLVSFPYGTPMEVIDTVVGNEAVSYEVVDDGEYHVNPNLPDYKLERLAGLEDVKKDIVVEVTTTLEDTVSRSAGKFDEYNLVSEVSSNAYFEADGSISNGSISVSANDTYFNENDQWNLDYIDIPKAWNRFSTVSRVFSVWIAVIDCGVKMNHPDLQDRLLTNYSVDVTQSLSSGGYKKLIDLSDTASTTGQYTGSHGTMVAGVIAAQGNNSKGIAGVASIASDSFARNSFKIMAIKADDNGPTDDRHITQAHLDAAVDYAVENGAEIINISYSAPRSSYYHENSYMHLDNLEESIANAISHGVSVVASAGNDGSTTVRYPAGFDGVIGVGATLKNGNMAAYSNWSDAVDILAPGGYGGTGGNKIRSTSTSVNLYEESHGTSYAAPHVAATIAMMNTLNYELTPAQYLTRLLNRGNPYGAWDVIELDTGEAVRLMDEI